MRLARLIGPELETLLRESPAEVAELLDEIHPEDLADIVSEFEQEKASTLLNQLPPEYAAQVFERLDEQQQASIAETLGLDSTARLAAEMDPDDLADFVGALPLEVGAPLLERIERFDPEFAEDVEGLTRWPDSSAGGLMTTDFISVGPGLRVHEAIEELRRRADTAETLDSIYVVTPERHLIGFLTLRNLLLSDPNESVNTVMQTNVISVTPELDQEEVARTLGKYDLNALPVIDQNGCILGVITSDDVLDVLTEEQNEDVQKMGAIEPIEHGYFDASFGMFIRKRAPWLSILFVGGYFTTSAMEAFDGVLKAIAHLAFYVPLLISAGGNSGAQSSTLVIRGLALGDITTRDWLRVLLRELGQGIALGSLLAAFGVVRVVLGGDGAEMAILVAFTIVTIVTMGCVVGGMMPLLLHRLKIDPASSSTPFIATLVDVLGIVIYLSLARWLLSDLLSQASFAT